MKKIYLSVITKNNIYERGVAMPASPAVSAMNISGLSDALTLAKFQGVIEAVLPIVAVAVLVGFLFYVVRWAIGLFRGI